MAEEDKDDEKDTTDPDSYYTSALADTPEQEVRTLTGKTFRHSIRKEKGYT